MSGRDMVGIAQTGSGKTLAVSNTSFLCCFPYIISILVSLYEYFFVTVHFASCSSHQLSTQDSS